ARTGADSAVATSAGGSPGGGARGPEALPGEEGEQLGRGVLQHGPASETPLRVGGPQGVAGDDRADRGGGSGRAAQRDGSGGTLGNVRGRADARAQGEVGVDGAVELAQSDPARATPAARARRGHGGGELVGRCGVRMPGEGG